MVYMAHKTKLALHIMGLAFFTFVLAAAALFIPKILQAPKTPEKDYLPETQIQTPDPALLLNDLMNHDRVNPGQVITGKAPGYYFFEGSFPVVLLDINGNPFTTVIAKTDEDWMVTQTAHFSVTLPPLFSYTGVGSIMFKKNDPSDNEVPFDSIKDQRIIPVIFEN